MLKEKLCRKCNQMLSAHSFGKDPKAKTGLRAWCKECNRTYQREWRRRNKEKINERIRKRYKTQRASMTEPTRRYRSRLRRQAIKAYGAQCQCCQETHIEFLAIDHINGGGAHHRKSLGGKNFYLWLKEQGYPQDEFRCLCHNCNASLGLYGYCPHRTPSEQPFCGEKSATSAGV
jgi:hypothetical protein